MFIEIFATIGVGLDALFRAIPEKFRLNAWLGAGVLVAVSSIVYPGLVSVIEKIMNYKKNLLLFAAGLVVAVNAGAQSEKIRAVELVTAEEPQATTDYSVTTTANNWNQQDADYQDTEFGELLYNEASVPTRIEILSLLSKETPSMLVFLQAISMGLGIGDVLDAAVRYEPNRGRDFAQSAISLLPLLTESTSYTYDKYELEDLDKDDESKLYSVKQVAERFFEHQSILVPYADWVEGQYHFVASAAELQELAALNEDVKWYRNDSNNSISERPIFVSLYEANKAVLVDNPARIKQILEQRGSDARLPVVIVFNRLTERPVDQLDYPLTLRGVQRAYSENSIMLTPAPEWELGEYHIKAKLSEFDEIFDLPEEQDFEAEHWQRLVQQANAYNLNSPAFLTVVLSSGDEGVAFQWQTGQQFAAVKDPRDDAAFPYISPGNDSDGQNNNDTVRLDLKALVSQGLILNRPDLIAALLSIGTSEVPVAFYYIDNARTKPFFRGPRALRAIAVGAGTPPQNFGGHGGFGPPPEIPPEPPVASPPATN